MEFEAGPSPRRAVTVVRLELAATVQVLLGVTEPPPSNWVGLALPMSKSEGDGPAARGQASVMCQTHRRSSNPAECTHTSGGTVTLALRVRSRSLAARGLSSRSRSWSRLWHALHDYFDPKDRVRGQRDGMPIEDEPIRNIVTTS